MPCWLQTVHRMTEAGDKRSAKARWNILMKAEVLQPPYQLTAAHPLPDSLFSALLVRLHVLIASFIVGVCSAWDGLGNFSP